MKKEESLTQKQLIEQFSFDNRAWQYSAPLQVVKRAPYFLNKKGSFLKISYKKGSFSQNLFHV